MTATRWRSALPLVDALLVGALAMTAALFVTFGRDTIYANYTLLAQAFLGGHVWVNWPGPYIDALPFEGQYFVIEGPVPALLVLPFVAVFHHVNQTWAACATAGLAMAAAWELTRRIPVVSKIDRALLLAFVFVGSGLLWCAMLGDVWFFAHVASVAFALLALVEINGKARPWLVAVCAILAAGSRFALVLTIPVLLYWAWQKRRTAPLAFALQCAAVLLPALIAYVTYNEVRWHEPIDRGYWLWFRTADPIGDPTGSPFELAYIPYELASFFVYGFRMIGSFPFAIPDLNGQSLLVTAPALIIAFFARRPRTEVIFAWVLVAVTAAPNFVYYTNGAAQFGMRHALDFIPFLFALMLYRAATRPLSWWQRTLCVYSTLVGCYGIWYWNSVYRAGS